MRGRGAVPVRPESAPGVPLHLTLAAERPVRNHEPVIERPACRHHHRLPPASSPSVLTALCIPSPAKIKTDVILEE